MTFPANADSDPDPTSQIAWPGRQGKRDSTNGKHQPVSERDRRGSRSSAPNGGPLKPTPAGPTEEAEGSSEKKRMSTLDLIYLSISMGGSQVAWTVELG